VTFRPRREHTPALPKALPSAETQNHPLRRAGGAAASSPTLKSNRNSVVLLLEQIHRGRLPYRYTIGADMRTLSSSGGATDSPISGSGGTGVVFCLPCSEVSRNVCARCVPAEERERFPTRPQKQIAALTTASVEGFEPTAWSLPKPSAVLVCGSCKPSGVYAAHAQRTFTGPLTKANFRLADLTPECRRRSLICSMGARSNGAGPTRSKPYPRTSSMNRQNTTRPVR
jgi:hypothetical protein